MIDSSGRTPRKIGPRVGRQAVIIEANASMCAHLSLFSESSKSCQFDSFSSADLLTQPVFSVCSTIVE
jgi:hypothetical protein